MRACRSRRPRQPPILLRGPSTAPGRGRVRPGAGDYSTPGQRSGWPGRVRRPSTPPRAVPPLEGQGVGESSSLTARRAALWKGRPFSLSLGQAPISGSNRCSEPLSRWYLRQVEGVHPRMRAPRRAHACVYWGSYYSRLDAWRLSVSAPEVESADEVGSTILVPEEYQTWSTSSSLARNDVLAQAVLALDFSWWYHCG